MHATNDFVLRIFGLFLNLERVQVLLSSMKEVLYQRMLVSMNKCLTSPYLIFKGIIPYYKDGDFLLVFKSVSKSMSNHIFEPVHEDPNLLKM